MVPLHRRRQKPLHRLLRFRQIMVPHRRRQKPLHRRRQKPLHRLLRFRQIMVPHRRQQKRQQTRLRRLHRKGHLHRLLQKRHHLLLQKRHHLLLQKRHHLLHQKLRHQLRRKLNHINIFAAIYLKTTRLYENKYSLQII